MHVYTEADGWRHVGGWATLGHEMVQFRGATVEARGLLPFVQSCGGKGDVSIEKMTSVWMEWGGGEGEEESTFEEHVAVPRFSLVVEVEEAKDGAAARIDALRVRTDQGQQ